MFRRTSLVLLAVSLLAAASPGAPLRTPQPSTTPTPRPTPIPPERVAETARRGARVLERSSRYSNPSVAYSQLLRVEEVDLDRDGVFEALVDGIGSVRSVPAGIPTSGFVSRQRLPFESPLLTVLKRTGGEWRALFIAHVPLRCAQTGDLSACDELVDFRSVRFRYDDRPQVLFHVQHAGDSGTNEATTLRVLRGALEPTFTVSEPRSAVEVEASPLGIRRRIAVDTFLNRELPPRYRSFTLATNLVFGERAFRVQMEGIEEEWSERKDADLAYWGLVHQPGFAEELERFRERQRKANGEGAWSLDPIEVARRRFPDGSRFRLGVRQPGVAVVYFERAGCAARAVLYQPLREWDGERSLWELAMIRAGSDLPFECLKEPPLER